MKTIKINVPAYGDFRNQVIPLGKMGDGRGDTSILQVVFDCKQLAKQYGAGTAELLHQRSGDSAPYICDVTQDGDTVIWDISKADTAKAGNGDAELRWYVGSSVQKTTHYKTQTSTALFADVEPPSPIKPWVDRVLDAAQLILQGGVDTEVVNATIITAVTNYLDNHDIDTLTEQEVKGIVQETLVAYVEEHKEELRGERGEQGERGADGLPGQRGADGLPGERGADGRNGVDGKSAYELALEHGYAGTEAQWLEYLKGEKGDQGERGERGADGAKGETGDRGERGYQGEQGVPGLDGKNAYEIALENGYFGTVAQWLASLKGQPGENYILTPADKAEIASMISPGGGVNGYVPPSGGIPRADLSQDVRESLYKADTAVQMDDIEGFARTADVFTKAQADERYARKGEGGGTATDATQITYGNGSVADALTAQSGDIVRLDNAVATSATVSNGVATFKNAKGQTLFSMTIPTGSGNASGMTEAQVRALIDTYNFALKSELPASWTETQIRNLITGYGYGSYTKPTGGIPASDLAEDYLTEAEADEKYAGSVSRLKGHSVFILGDSLSVQADGMSKYYDIMSERAGGMSVTVNAVGGRQLVNFPVDSVANADVIIVMGGTNDWDHANAIGTIDDDTTATFMGAVNHIIDTLQTNFPASRIILVTPIGASWESAWNMTDPKKYPAVNRAGKTINEYVDAMLQCCAKHRVECIDLYRTCGMNPDNASSNAKYFSDGLHLNAIGHDNLSWIIERVIDSAWIPDTSNAGDAPVVTVSSISAVLNMGDDILTTANSVDDIRPYLTVTAHMSDGGTKNITSYSVSGSMEAGQQTITVKYSGKSTTVTVLVVSAEQEIIGGALVNGSRTLTAVPLKIDVTNGKHVKIEFTSTASMPASGFYVPLLNINTLMKDSVAGNANNQNGWIWNSVGADTNVSSSGRLSLSLDDGHYGMYITNIVRNDLFKSSNTIDINPNFKGNGLTQDWTGDDGKGIGSVYGKNETSKQLMFNSSNGSIMFLGVWVCATNGAQVGAAIEFDVACDIPGLPIE